MTIRKSAEDYLYAIHRLCLSKGYTRSVDIAPIFSVSNPSVGNIRENGYISFNANNRISLTGRQAIATRFFEPYPTPVHRL